MFEIPNMVMIGSNSRNAGKTTLACNLIKSWSSTHRVVGLKVTSIRPGEADKHGTHLEDASSDFSITEELDSESYKDTSLMLKAGAHKVYYIRSSDNLLEKAFKSFLILEPHKPVFVCESRNLRKVVNPGIMIMMMRFPAFGKEKDVSEYLVLADIIGNLSKNEGQSVEDISNKITMGSDNKICLKESADQEITNAKL